MKICAAPDCTNEFDKQDKRVKYCGHACSARTSNRRRAGTSYKTGESTLGRVCARCDKPMGTTRGARYCSTLCARKHRAEVYVERWLAGDETGSNTPGGLKSFVRAWLLLEAGDRCTSSKCSTPGGWGIPNPKTGRPILAIEHLDGNWKNNTRENLMVLCYNCHTLSETFGSLNAGSLSGTRANADLRRR